jgi:6-phosphogluconolactonase/glucosamine-6-phosphate isomerase/deaminase
MKYILTAAWDDGVADLTERLIRELAAGKRVLWLLSGGSNIPASISIMSNIDDDLSRALSVSLADERYGPPGHADSNWTQLLEAGFDAKNARLLPVLQKDTDFEKAVEAYEELAKAAFAANDVIIMQLGIGEDGHIAGILPDSPAAKEPTALAAGYKAPPLSRLTLTFPALSRATAAYAFAFGKPKAKALAALRSESLDPVKQPAQILKKLPEAYLYSDQVGEHA